MITYTRTHVLTPEEHRSASQSVFETSDLIFVKEGDDITCVKDRLGFFGSRVRWTPATSKAEDDPSYVQETEKLFSKKAVARLNLLGISEIRHLIPRMSRQMLAVLLSKKDYDEVIEYLDMWQIKVLGD